MSGTKTKYKGNCCLCSECCSGLWMVSEVMSCVALHVYAVPIRNEWLTGASPPPLLPWETAEVHERIKIEMFSLISSA